MINKIQIKVFITLITTISFMSSCDCNSDKLEEKTPLAKHVIVIGVDGFGAFAVEKAEIPNIKKMMKEGAYSLKARCVLPSSSAINWASLFTGVGTELHGYTKWNSATPEIPSRVVDKNGKFPTIFSVIKEQKPDSKLGAAYTWSGIAPLIDKEILDFDHPGLSDVNTTKAVLKYLDKEEPTLLFMHFDEVDGAGHKHGYDTKKYYRLLKYIDKLVGRILKKLEEKNMMDDTIIILTADHGGLNNDHGGMTLEEMEIPWIIYGSNVKPIGEMESVIVTYDTPATIAHILGIKAPQYWRGKAITEPFAKNIDHE